MYTKNYNDKINSIISNIKNKYPNIEESDIIEIINNEEDSEDILSKYGIDSITKNDKVNNTKRGHYLVLPTRGIIMSSVLEIVKIDQDSLVLRDNYSKNETFYRAIKKKELKKMVDRK